MLSTRDIAWLLYTLLFVVWAMRNASLRHAAAGVLRAAFSFVFIRIYIALGAYLAILIVPIIATDVWTVTNTKDCILWLLVVAAPSLFSINKLRECSAFKGKLRDVIKLTVVLEFIVGLYTFPLWAELLLAPLLVILLLMQAVIKIDKSQDPNGSIQRLIDGIMAVLGFALVPYIALQIYVGPGELFSLRNLQSFIVPVILSIYFLPFLYILSLYVLYEGIYMRLPFKVRDDSVRRRVWRCILQIGNFRLDKVNRISYQIILVDDFSVHNDCRIIRAISEIDNNDAIAGARWNDNLDSTE